MFNKCVITDLKLVYPNYLTINTPNWLAGASLPVEKNV